jgi:hypothetical protein
VEKTQTTEQEFDLSTLNLASGIYKISIKSVVGGLSSKESVGLNYLVDKENEYLFRNRKITDIPSVEIPAPVPYVYYQAVIIDNYGNKYYRNGTGGNEETYFGESGEEVWLIYNEGWFFHPIDSGITVADVSIMITGYPEYYQSYN